MFLFQRKVLLDIFLKCAARPSVTFLWNKTRFMPKQGRHVY